MHVHKNYEKSLWFELATVTSQAFKYDVINCFFIYGDGNWRCLINFCQHVKQFYAMFL